LEPNALLPNPGFSMPLVVPDDAPGFIAAICIAGKVAKFMVGRGATEWDPTLPFDGKCLFFRVIAQKRALWRVSGNLVLCELGSCLQLVFRRVVIKNA
jgi:hypothetical protein